MPKVIQNGTEPASIESHICLISKPWYPAAHQVWVTRASIRGIRPQQSMNEGDRSRAVDKERKYTQLSVVLANQNGRGFCSRICKKFSSPLGEIADKVDTY